MELNSKNIKKILLIILCGSIIFTIVQNIGAVGLSISKIFGIFSPVIAALCIAFVLNVLLTALETKVFSFMDKSKKAITKKLKRPICLILTYLIAFGIVGILMVFIIPDIIDTITYIADKLPNFIVQSRDWIDTTLQKFHINNVDIPELKINWNSVATTIKNWVGNYSGRFVGEAVNITTSFFTGLFDTVFSFVISVYILAQKEKIGKFVKRLIDCTLPKKVSYIIYKISTQASYSFGRFIGGQLTEAFILGSLCFIGMTIFRFPNALIISALICVTALVPIIGATVGVVFGTLLIMITNPIKALLFILFFIVLQQIEGNLIYPKVVGKAVGLPGVIVVSAVLVGGNIGGILGTLVAVPTCALIYALVKEYIAHKETLSKNVNLM